MEFGPSFSLEKYKKKKQSSELMAEEGVEKEKEGMDACMEKIGEIKDNFSSQPISVQAIFSSFEEGRRFQDRDPEDYFCESKKIDGKEFLLTRIDPEDEAVLTLVRDEKNDKKWKTRVFRFSKSGYQWKSLPGIRPDGISYMKGDESHEKHHYIQSAKLHPDMYKSINDLPRLNDEMDGAYYQNFVPVKPDSDKKGKIWYEFEFEEKYRTLKNPDWRKYQKQRQAIYDYYKVFISKERAVKKYDNKSAFYQNLEVLPRDFTELKNKVDELSSDPYLKKELNQSLADMEKSPNQKIKEFAELYKKEIGSFFVDLFKERNPKISIPESMMPDFSNSPVDSYEKPHIKEDESVYIEEYKVDSPEGDELIFAMAYDDKGRVYIDNIYDPRVGMSDYGTLKEIVQMGYLVYKPEDYKSQTRAIPEKYKRKGERDYVEINKLWQEIPVIKKFKENLTKRKKV